MLGYYLKNRRIAMGLTQDYVASKLNVSRQAISNWENGSREIHFHDLIAYAKILEISFEDLEVHINKYENEKKHVSYTHSNHSLPNHLDLTIRRRKGDTKGKKYIKIEGDKVVGVHLLLSSLFFINKRLTVNNCPSALDFQNVIDKFICQGWAKTSVHKDSVTIESFKYPFDISELNMVSRASIGLISALTYKNHQLVFAFPGGDGFCYRPIDLHLDILSTIASYKYDKIEKIYYSEKKDILNKNISLNCYADGCKSVGAFFNALSLAYVYPNEIVITGISPDPTIYYLIELLQKSTNRRIKYITADKIGISKVDMIEINDAEITIPPDMSMLVSYVLLFWEELEDVIFENISIADIPENYINLFEKFGLKIYEMKQGISFKRESEISADYFEFLRLGALPFITTDLGPIISEFLAAHNISSIMFDEVFINRSTHISELEKLGINIQVLENGAIKTVNRNEDSISEDVHFDLKDIRAGMAIIMGIKQSNIEKAILHNFDQVLRGFGNIRDIIDKLGYEVHEFEGANE